METRCMNVLVIDAGTSSMKAYLYCSSGECLFEKRRHYQVTACENQVEMDTGIAVEALHSLLQSAGEWLFDAGMTLDAISLTAQRSSVACVKADGTPLTPMMMWQDRRAQGVCDAHEKEEREIHEICGMTPTPVCSAPKIQWIRENKPAVYEQAGKLVGFYELLLFHLVGGWYTDDTIASRSCLMDLEMGRWSEHLLGLFGVDQQKLCSILPAGTVLYATRQVRERLRQRKPVGVVLAGGDQQCAALGGGCLRAGDIQINTGTGGYVLGMLSLDVARTGRRVNYNRATLPGTVLAEGYLPYCCNAIDRFCKLLYPQEAEGMKCFAQALEGSQEGAGGLKIVPETLGNAGLWEDESMRKKLAQWSIGYGEANIVRALVEGIVETLAACARRVAGACQAPLPPSMVCGGGLTQNPLFCQLLAQRLGCGLMVPKEENITALGALLLAWKALLPGFLIEQAWREQIQKSGMQVYMPCTSGSP